ncbi:DUF3871 family protein, partial [uncultured Sanguibacteroides sp.]
MNTTTLIPNQNEGLLPVLFGSSDIKEEPTYTPYELIKDEEPGKKEKRRKHFIEANTEPIDMQRLKDDCIVPVFSKDNEMTISHPAFIETVHKVASELFRGESIDEPDIM